MRKFLGFLVIIAVCVIALGVYMDWFHFTKNDNKGSGQIDVGLTIDENKMKEDAEKAREKAKVAGDRAKGQIDDAKPASAKDRAAP